MKREMTPNKFNISEKPISNDACIVTVFACVLLVSDTVIGLKLNNITLYFTYT